MENTFTSEPNEQNSDLEETYIMKKKRKLGVSNHQKRSVTIESLPSAVLEIIFSFLPLYDLLNVRSISEAWENVTNYSLVWKNAPLVLHYHSYLEKLSFLPYLYTVTGKFFHGDELLEALINNVKDLRRMDCEIVEHLSPELVERFVGKFKNLESFRFCEGRPVLPSSNSCPDFEVSLIYISSCLNLKALHLSNFYDFEHFSHVCKIIEDGFQALRCLNISRLDCPEQEKSALSFLLVKKIHQLTALHVSCDDVYPDVLELVFKSSMLQKLEIIINTVPMTPLDLQYMTSLRSVIVSFECQLPDSFRYPESYESENNKLFQTNCFPTNLEYLEISFTSMIKPYTGIINSVHSLPHLKELAVTGAGDWDIDKQLEKISNLSRLHTISLHNCLGLSSVGMDHIIKCPDLKTLKVSGISFADSTLKCKYLSYLQLDSCVLNLKQFVSDILLMENLLTIIICKCSYRSTKAGRPVLIEGYMLNKLRMDCRGKGRNIVIRCSN